MSLPLVPKQGTELLSGFSLIFLSNCENLGNKLTSRFNFICICHIKQPAGKSILSGTRVFQREETKTSSQMTSETSTFKRLVDKLILSTTESSSQTTSKTSSFKRFVDKLILSTTGVFHDELKSEGRTKSPSRMPRLRPHVYQNESFKDINFEKGSSYSGLHLFTYSELEEATNYFHRSRHLGSGGFGHVYLGKLRDGHCVAVKWLYENNYRIEQFMNEVEILTRLVHPNLVKLYGCTSNHSTKHLLVYEYIPNGTVADHLRGKRAKLEKLPWHIRMNIAVETASALKYLHVSDIIHRDVKTDNILLDNHFHVKVADFGLSRYFPSSVTHISTAPCGTLGYGAPEYQQLGHVSYKIDIYSFGVVLVELISSLPVVDKTRNGAEISLANMAINKIRNQALHELVDPSLGFESDPKVRKMINAVAELAFQCLQSSKDLRPSMEQVVDTLEDISALADDDDVVFLKHDLPSPSPDWNAVSTEQVYNTKC